MGTRTFALTALLLSWGASGACGGSEPPPAPLRAGSAAPQEWTGARREHAARTYLVWVVRTEDCFTCQEVDYEFRRVQARWGSDVPLRVLHVGSARSESVPRAFLASRRIQASYQTVSPRAFERRFGNSVVPAIHLVNNGTIVWSSADLRKPGPTRLSLDSLVSLQRSAAKP